MGKFVNYRPMCTTYSEITLETNIICVINRHKPMRDYINNVHVRPEGVEKVLE